MQWIEDLGEIKYAYKRSNDVVFSYIFLWPLVRKWLYIMLNIYLTTLYILHVLVYLTQPS